MKIDLPSLTNFNKNLLAPSNEKLASFTVGQLPKNIMKPFMFISTSKLSVYYQKLRDRYEYLRQLEPLTPCDPKCQEGWYWDCETETCKEYSGYNVNFTGEVILKGKGKVITGYDSNAKIYFFGETIELDVIAVDHSPRSYYTSIKPISSYTESSGLCNTTNCHSNPPGSTRVTSYEQIVNGNNLITKAKDYTTNGGICDNCFIGDLYASWEEFPEWWGLFLTDERTIFAFHEEIVETAIIEGVK